MISIVPFVLSVAMSLGQHLGRVGWGWAVCLAMLTSLRAEQACNFSSLVTSQTRRTFETIRDYLQQHPQAEDRPAALVWLFQEALANGWEVDAISLSEQVLRSNAADPDLRWWARQCLTLGRARRGELVEVLHELDADWNSRKTRNPNKDIDFCQSIAVRFQLRQERAAAEAVYERLESAYLLQPDVRAACEDRKKRLQLLGQAPPPLDGTDLEGRKLNWTNFQGKTVVLDFWATNCRPCLDELPRLKQIAREFRPRGIEIVGLSLDTDVATVRAFRDHHGIAWPLALDEAQVAARFGVTRIPCVMVIDPQGHVVAVDVPPQDLRWILRRWEE